MQGKDTTKSTFDQLFNPILDHETGGKAIMSH